MSISVQVQHLGSQSSALLQLFSVGLPARVSTVIACTMVGPYLEEFVFRGSLLPSLASKLPLPSAVLSSSIVFALAHKDPGSFLQLSGIGCVLALAYAWTGNLAASVSYTGCIMQSFYSNIYTNSAIHRLPTLRKSRQTFRLFISCSKSASDVVNILQIVIRLLQGPFDKMACLEIRRF